MSTTHAGRQCCSGPGVGRHDDLHILIKGDEEAQETLNGEWPEISAQHFGDIWLLDAEQIGGLGLCPRYRLIRYVYSPPSA